MIIDTPAGSVRTMKKGRMRYSHFSHVTVRITFNDPDNDDMIKVLSRDFYSGIRKRSDITSAWVRERVSEMTSDVERLDLGNLTIRSVDVRAVSDIWTTPYEDIRQETD